MSGLRKLKQNASVENFRMEVKKLERANPDAAEKFLHDVVLYAVVLGQVDEWSVEAARSLCLAYGSDYAWEQIVAGALPESDLSAVQDVAREELFIYLAELLGAEKAELLAKGFGDE